MISKKLAATVLLLSSFGMMGVTGTNVARADSYLPAQANTEPNGDTGTATGKSDAVVNVLTGYLVLEAVPDMNFGGTVQTASPVKGLPLISNQGIIDDDGNNAGLLKVTDSRTPGAKGEGHTWKLTAAVDKFTSQDPKFAGGNDWQINLKQKNGRNTGNGMPSLLTPSLISNNTAQTVIQANEGRGSNSTLVYYDKPQTASLDMPGNIPTGQYSAPITWTLNAAVTAESN